MERNGLVLFVWVLAAVSRTGLPHPSGPQSLHFCGPSRQQQQLSFDTLASSVALANSTVMTASLGVTNVPVLFCLC